MVVRSLDTRTIESNRERLQVVKKREGKNGKLLSEREKVFVKE